MNTLASITQLHVFTSDPLYCSFGKKLAKKQVDPPPPRSWKSWTHYWYNHALAFKRHFKIFVFSKCPAVLLLFLNWECTRNPIFILVTILRMIFWGFLWNALYSDVKVPRDLKTMVVCGAPQKVYHVLLKGAAPQISLELCELKTGKSRNG